MMQPPQARLLPDGQRLHLNHGPIDLIIEAWSTDRTAAYTRATNRFETILQELVADLPALRSPMPGPKNLTSPTARRMQVATLTFAPHFVTPMAAVAGAVADEILAQITVDPTIRKAYVNNGGDVAFHLTGHETISTAIATTPPAKLTLTSADHWRGIATSGWRGRSHSLGIADSVTVLAHTAAAADAAATMIANAVDLPGDPRITRHPAHDLAPDSDLRERPVTTYVAPLDPQSRAGALDAGLARAISYREQGLIAAAYLTLQGKTRATGPLPALQPEPQNA